MVGVLDFDQEEISLKGERRYLLIKEKLRTGQRVEEIYNPQLNKLLYVSDKICWWLVLLKIKRAASENGPLYYFIEGQIDMKTE